MMCLAKDYRLFLEMLQHGSKREPLGMVGTSLLVLPTFSRLASSNSRLEKCDLTSRSTYSFPIRNHGASRSLDEGAFSD